MSEKHSRYPKMPQKNSNWKNLEGDRFLSNLVLVDWHWLAGQNCYNEKKDCFLDYSVDLTGWIKTKEGSCKLQLKQGVFISTATPLNSRLSWKSFIYHLSIKCEKVPYLTRFSKVLRAWLSKWKPLASTEAYMNPLQSLFSFLGQLNSLEDNLSFDHSSFDRLIKANQLGPEF